MEELTHQQLAAKSFCILNSWIMDIHECIKYIRKKTGHGGRRVNIRAGGGASSGANGGASSGANIGASGGASSGAHIGASGGACNGAINGANIASNGPWDSLRTTITKK
uniref:Uncharacterized protein n=1 Tax=Knipowitschia caucasica TaxID=637954 RepID=A0AAV2M4N9_KNICA